MNFKEKIYLHYKELLAEKIKQLQQVLQDLHYSASNETKSTAGDKHETALAMLQIEQQNKRNQLSELLKQDALLDKINPAVIAPYVLNGSLIQTDKGYFFISTALGKIVIDGKTVFALSPSSPLGKQLMGLKINGQAKVNESIYNILSVK